jgi:hypothetical protein
MLCFHKNNWQNLTTTMPNDDISHPSFNCPFFQTPTAGSEMENLVELQLQIFFLFWRMSVSPLNTLLEVCFWL